MLLPCEEGRISENKETGGCRQKGPRSVKESSAVKLPATFKFLAHRIAVEAVGTFLGRLSCTKLNSTGTHPSGAIGPRGASPSATSSKSSDEARSANRGQEHKARDSRRVSREKAEKQCDCKLSPSCDRLVLSLQSSGRTAACHSHAR
ncbi:hypothetical protein ABZX51_005766 [Aspergillus tubingensis]